MANFENLKLSEDDERKAIRLAKSIEKKFNELQKLGVGVVMAIGGGSPSFMYYPTELINIMSENNHLNSDMGGIESDVIDGYTEYQIHESSHNNIYV